MTSPLCQVKDGAGAYGPTLNGVNVTPTHTITIKLADATGVKLWSVACIDTDDLSDADTITAGLTIDSSAKTASFTAPAAGSALIFQSKIGINALGFNANGAPDATFTTTFAIYTLAASGFRVAAVNETTEGNAKFGTAATINAIIRNPGGVTLAPAGTGPAKVTGGSFDANASPNDLSNSVEITGTLPYARTQPQVGQFHTVRAAATGNVASLTGAQTLDGIACIAGDDVFLPSQSTASQNGPWTVGSPWVRPGYYATGLVKPQALVRVAEGSTLAKRAYSLDTSGTITVDTTATTWGLVPIPGNDISSDGQNVLAATGTANVFRMKATSMEPPQAGSGAGAARSWIGQAAATGSNANGGDATYKGGSGDGSGTRGDTHISSFVDLYDTSSTSLTAYRSMTNKSVAYTQVTESRTTTSATAQVIGSVDWSTDNQAFAIQALVLGEDDSGAACFYQLSSSWGRLSGTVTDPATTPTAFDMGSDFNPNLRVNRSGIHIQILGDPLQATDWTIFWGIPTRAK